MEISGYDLTYHILAFDHRASSDVRDHTEWLLIWQKIRVQAGDVPKLANGRFYFQSAGQHFFVGYQLTRGGVSRHVDDRISAVDNIVVCQGGRSTCHLDVVTCMGQRNINSSLRTRTHHFEWQ